MSKLPRKSKPKPDSDNFGTLRGALKSTTDDWAKEYDVALSFCSQDEPLATDLFTRLSPDFRVFLYSKKQEQIAGTDGMETFGGVFRSRTRLVVILYRDGWGDSKWTGIEEMAIKDRLFNAEAGWDSLLIVKLDPKSTLRKWMPTTKMYFDLSTFPIDQLVGAIKARLLDLGIKPKKETAVERAARLEVEEGARAERQAKLDSEGNAAFQRETLTVYGEIMRLGRMLNDKSPTLGITGGYLNRDECVINTSEAGLNVFPHQDFRPTDSRLTIQEWLVPVILPQERGRKNWGGDKPRVRKRHKFGFDYTAAFGWCWRDLSMQERYLSPTDLAEHCLKLLLDLHDEIRRGLHPKRFEGG